MQPPYNVLGKTSSLLKFAFLVLTWPTIERCTCVAFQDVQGLHVTNVTTSATAISAGTVKASGDYYTFAASTLSVRSGVNYSNIPSMDITNTSLSVNGSHNSTSTNRTKPPPERNLIYFVIGPVICGVGIICNIINLAVLAQKELNDSPYTYLTALAISDLTLLVTSFVHLVISEQPYTYMKSFYDVYIFFSFGNIFFNSSVWLVVILTLERVMFVKRPLHFHSSRKRALLSCGCVFVFCGIINIPKFFCYDVKYQNGNYYPRGLEFRKTKLYYRVSWAYALLNTFIPIMILLATNIILIHALHTASKERASMRSNQERTSRQEQTRLTRTLVVIVIVFIICTTPSAFVEEPIAYSLFGGDKEWIDYINSPSNQLLIYISNWLLFLNASLNFFLYCAFNRKYRHATKRLLKKFHTNKKLFASFRKAVSYNTPNTEETDCV